MKGEEGEAERDLGQRGPGVVPHVRQEDRNRLRPPRPDDEPGQHREELRRYFEVAHDRLVRDGLFYTEIYGGSEAVVTVAEERKEDGFRVIWDQEVYNPITHETLCHLHFKFRDGSRLDRAFTYDWRLWGVPEIREIMAEAGFAQSRVYWEEVDEDGEGTGEYRATESEENQETWLVYVVGVK